MRILVVEDEAKLLDILMRCLKGEGLIADGVGSAEAAFEYIKSFHYDLVILDLLLPDSPGTALLRRIRSERHAMPVLILTARSDIDSKAEGFSAGADDYLTKPFDSEELLARVRAGLRHRLDSQGAEHRVEAGEVVIDLDKRRVTRAGEEVHLAPKEYGVLALLAQRPDRVLSHAQILREVWGPAQADRVEYLRIVVRALRQKLEADPARPALIVNELGVGYRLRPEA